MAELLTVTVHADGTTWKTRCVFRSRLLRLLPIGGLCLSRGTVRFKRDRKSIPLWLVGHELRHTVQAHRMGWRYIPTHLWVQATARLRKSWHWMEVEAEGLARRWGINAPQAWEAPAYPVPRTWWAPPARP